MRVPATFGQYVPVDSPVHALDARVKMAAVASFTALLFMAEGFVGLGFAAALLVGAIALSRVPLRLALRGVRAVSFILIITLLANALRWNPATISLVRVGPLAVDGQGLVTGLFFATRIVLLVIGTSLLTLTTSPVALTDALERIMRPLARLGFPAGEVAMMLTIALRFIPTTAQEAEKIIVAQTARGARFDEGGLITRVRAYVPVLVPLFVNLFRRADDLATAMESRCYRGGTERTRLREAVMRSSDWVTLAVVPTVLVLLGVWL